MTPQPSICPICGDSMEFIFQETVLGRHRVSYFNCGGCGLVQTERPFWLEEAYQSPIAAGDTGLVARNLDHCRFLEAFLPLVFPATAKFVDLAGGYGLLARLLRDKGFHCYSTDPHCSSLFAGVSEPEPPFQAEALFAFEVLEHLHDPAAFIKEGFAMHGCRTLIFSTLTFAGPPPTRDWWYYAFDSGQHVSFYQKQTLARLAAKLDCTYHQVTAGLHVISAAPLPFLARWALRSRTVRRLLALWVRLARPRKSLTWDDHLECQRRLQARQESGQPPTTSSRA
jgi:hypothetical protein